MTVSCRSGFSIFRVETREQLIAISGRMIRPHRPCAAAVRHRCDFRQRGFLQVDVGRDDDKCRAAEERVLDRAGGLAGNQPVHHLDAVGKRAVWTPRAGDDLPGRPVEDVSGGVDHRERSDDDIAEDQAGGSNAPFHSGIPACDVHLADRRAGAGTDVPLDNGS